MRDQCLQVPVDRPYAPVDLVCDGFCGHAESRNLKKDVITLLNQLAPRGVFHEDLVHSPARAITVASNPLRFVDRLDNRILARPGRWPWADLEPGLLDVGDHGKNQPTKFMVAGIFD